MQVSSAAADSAGSTIKSGNDDGWTNNAKAKLLNLGTSDSDVISFIQKAFSESADGANSEARRNIVQYLLSVRSEMASAASNMIRQIGETTRNIIANLRQ